MSNLKDLVGTSINNYVITKYINSGSFGDVFEAKHKKTDDLVALKIPIKTEEKDGQNSLLTEAKIYKVISNPENGIVNMKITSCKNKKIIVMDLLGPNLEKILASKKKISIKTITLFAMQMIEIIRYIHSCGYIHRDIKPDNFTLGYSDKKKIYCIDFGLAKRYKKRNDEHIPFSTERRFCGTARYASIAAHNNQEQGRKDDLESIAYILIYLFNGVLPWQGIKKKDKEERYRLIGLKKEEMSEEELTKGMPKEFCIFLKYVRNMNFEEKPHYTTLYKMFNNLYISLQKK